MNEPKPDIVENVPVEVVRIRGEVLLRVGFMVMGMTPEQARELAAMVERAAK